MSDEVLLETHIALWLDNGNARLRSSTRGLIEGWWRDGGTILISAVTAWEIARLVAAGRIQLDLSVEGWIERFVDRPGIRAVPLSLRAASRSYQLEHLMHRDPADRLLIATAMELTCPFVTYDARIRRFTRDHGDRYGFTVAM